MIAQPKPKKPYVSPELLTWLRNAFPNRLPEMTDMDREVWAKVGRQDVIRHLSALHDAQEKQA